ncbi:FAD-dependent oxidoreductase, partial [uncultured Marinobacter sp.]|uniref:FAD-dependent oxidoreductase n=1 Tax=uncultured Marinobacter sp. TaxID=187379 RepID=UPI00258E2D1A
MAVRQADVVLVGGGVMSATLGMMLRQLDPSLDIVMVERLDHVAHESTDGWNNAGTGHAGYCELNYTPETENGDVEIARALQINAQFEVSLQFWSYLVEQGILPEPSTFINRTPHQSFVWGEKDVAFLKRRFQKLKAHHLFREMEYTENPEDLAEWMPLVVSNRDPMQKVAATRIKHGSDVDFGSLTRSMVKWLETQPNFELMLSCPVHYIDQRDNGRWKVRVKNQKTGELTKLEAGFVFLGAGGGALPLLQKSGIDEARGYLIATLDGDLQNDPNDIPRMVAHLIERDLDLLTGWRKNRKDDLFLRKIPSRIANRLIGKITGVRINDYGCSLKIYKSSVIKQVRLYGEMHRFIPAWVAAVVPPSRIGEIVVNHNARVAGESKYGISRTFRVILDLLSVYFFMRYRARPGHFFGSIGLALGSVSGLLLVYL